MKKRLISLYMESKENFFLAKSVWFSYLKHVCVCMCVHMHVSVCRMVMFNLLESHSNTLSPISSNFFFRTACYRFQEPQVQVVQTMVVNQLCVSNPPTSSLLFFFLSGSSSPASSGHQSFSFQPPLSSHVHWMHTAAGQQTWPSPPDIEKKGFGNASSIGLISSHNIWDL